MSSWLQGSKLKDARGTLNVLRALKNTGMHVLLAPKKTNIKIFIFVHLDLDGQLI